MSGAGRSAAPVAGDTVTTDAISGVTVTWAVASLPFAVADTVVCPTPTPITCPLVVTVAIDVLAEVKLTVLVLIELPLQSNAVPLMLVAPFTGIVIVSGAMLTLHAATLGLSASQLTSAAVASVAAAMRTATRRETRVTAQEVVEAIDLKTRMQVRPVGNK